MMKSRPKKHTSPRTERGRATRCRDAALMPCGTLALFLRRGVGVDHVARLELLGVEDDLLAGDSELFDVDPLDALILDLQDPRLRPLAVRSETHLADDGAELVGADVVGHFLLLEALAALDGQAQDLDGGVRVRREVIAERIDTRLLGALLIFREELLDARE